MAFVNEISPEEREGLSNLYSKISSERSRRILHVNSEVRKSLRDFFIGEGFYELSPVILGPVTDPLNHPVSDASINYYGHKYGLTQSMIFHKQIALLSYEKLFIFSPNVRLEPLDRQATGRHLAEFSQLDVEVRDFSKDDAISLAERMYCFVIEQVRKSCAEDLEFFGRALSVPHIPFRRYDYSLAKERYGEEFEASLSENHKDPFFIENVALLDREFYDREMEERPGILSDMDMVYPEGFGEALSGGEREYQLERIIDRIKKKGQTFEQFKYYLEVARMGLPRSAGFGIGIERLVRYVLGLRNIEDATLFPKVIGKFSL
ncbi:asparagine synthetase [uncultured archaeon]|nr:asparagine synthetase [uncultured archaeon]HKJ96167.1 asparagine synthetase A [Thermoplasmataceae archaeon]